QDQLRLAANSADVEFAVQPGELPPAAGPLFEELLRPPGAPDGSAAAGAARLRSYERSVFSALERLLGEWNAAGFPGVPRAEAVALLPLAPCVARVAVPAWRVVVQVGLPEDFFEGGGRLAAAAAGAGRVAEEEGCWRRLPALRARLLGRRGWQVVRVPFFEWRSLAGGQEQRQFLRGRLREPARLAAERARGGPPAEGAQKDILAPCAPLSSSASDRPFYGYAGQAAA
ncbi:unnamed protein product, partial [Prorocentrum cordatum]